MSFFIWGVLFATFWIGFVVGSKWKTPIAPRILATANRRLQAENERLRNAVAAAHKELATIRTTATGAVANARLMLHIALNHDPEGDDW